MTNWTYKQKPDNAFMASFSNEAKGYLGISEGTPSTDISKWLLDSFQLTEANWPNKYSDYSFITVQASKALEAWIFKLANDLGIETTNDKVGVLQDQIVGQLNLLLEGVESKLGEIIKQEIAYLKIFIKEYRHEVVHCSHKMESSQQAKNKVMVLYEKINSITSKLIKAGLLKESA